MGMEEVNKEQQFKQVDLPFDEDGLIVDLDIPEKARYSEYTFEQKEEFMRLIREVQKYNDNEKDPKKKKKLSEKIERFIALNKEFWDESDERYR
jgi:hypothetical protein